MGLGSLFRIAPNGITGKMARFDVNSFNPKDMKMHLTQVNIDITPALFHDLLGIPLGGKDIYDTDQCEGKELMDWKQQYNYKFKESDELKEMKEIFEQEFNYKSQKEDGNEVIGDEIEKPQDGNEVIRDEVEKPQDGNKVDGNEA
ncbi:unnamed protein product [Lactuca saligna]|uniref:Uncharacterized protein n=1 Tax=Lactuca saligna TaxID=75948 RepID=A0AA36EH48_LACSI|nr:unnamed protein product [Lactuca saligna]